MVRGLPTISSPRRPCGGPDAGSGGRGCWFRGGQVRRVGPLAAAVLGGGEAWAASVSCSSTEALPGAACLGHFSGTSDLVPRGHLTTSASSGTSSAGPVASGPLQLAPPSHTQGHSLCSPGPGWNFLELRGLPIPSAYVHIFAPSSETPCPVASRRRIALGRGYTACRAPRLLRSCG